VKEIQEHMEAIDRIMKNKIKEREEKKK